MLLIIGNYKHARLLIKELGLNPQYCKIITHPEQLRGIDHGLPILRAHYKASSLDHHLMYTLIKERQLVILKY